MKTATTISWALCLAAFTFSPGAPAQGWDYVVQPYVMFPNMKGETGIADEYVQETLVPSL